jgi:hypothetical protein
MTRIATKTRLAAALMGVAVAIAFSTAASAHTQVSVNPSTGYASDAPAPDREIYVNPSTGFPGSDEAAEATSPAAPLPASEEPSSGAGFDWPSAGIGAAGGTALILVLLAFTVVKSRRGRGPLVPRRQVRT